MLYPHPTPACDEDPLLNCGWMDFQDGTAQFLHMPPCAEADPRETP